MSLRDELEKFWKAAWDNHDKKNPDLFLALYTDDCTMALPNMPMHKKKDMRPLFEMLLNSSDPVSDQTHDVIELAPGVALKTGVFVMKDKQGKQTEHWYCATLKKVDGQWKIVCEASGNTAPETK